MPVEGVDRETYMAAKMPDQVRLERAHVELERQGEASGIRFRFDLINKVPNTRRSHLLIAHAARRGLQAAVKDRIMRAYFEEGCDIGDPDELVRLGCEVGLSGAEARNALILRIGQDGVVAAERHASVFGNYRRTYLYFRRPVHDFRCAGSRVLAQVFDQVAEFASAGGVAS